MVIMFLSKSRGAYFEAPRSVLRSAQTCDVHATTLGPHQHHPAQSGEAVETSNAHCSFNPTNSDGLVLSDKNFVCCYARLRLMVMLSTPRSQNGRPSSILGIPRMTRPNSLRNSPVVNL